ncbi:sugar phosphate isomerase/epimerase family protein [Streptomyces sp. NPDC053048]|uniref:sugar phosphate isomerase/epimerase family protein n=1 Tax=Streptomyces sp. NPDC053048 TaxID=3365694 RepID=UPI0037D20727
MNAPVPTAVPQFTACLNPATLSGIPLPRFLTLAAQAGFTAVEVSIQQVVAHGPQQIRDMLDRHGLRAVAASGILPAGPVLPAPLLIPDEQYAELLDDLPHRLAAFQTLGCPTATIVLNPFSSWPRPDALARARSRITQLADAAAPYGVRLALEAVSVTRGLPPELTGEHLVLGDLPSLARLIQETGRTDVGVLVDSFHWAAAGAHRGHITGLGDGAVGHVQIADLPTGVTPQDATDEMRLFPGDGSLPWRTFGQALATVGYTGAVSVELFNPALRALPVGEIAERAQHSAVSRWSLAEVTS